MPHRPPGLTGSQCRDRGRSAKPGQSLASQVGRVGEPNARAPLRRANPAQKRNATAPCWVRLVTVSDLSLRQHLQPGTEGLRPAVSSFRSSPLRGADHIDIHLVRSCDKGSKVVKTPLPFQASRRRPALGNGRREDERVRERDHLRPAAERNGIGWAGLANGDPLVQIAWSLRGTYALRYGADRLGRHTGRAGRSAGTLLPRRSRWPTRARWSARPRWAARASGSARADLGSVERGLARLAVLRRSIDHPERITTGRIQLVTGVNDPLLGNPESTHTQSQPPTSIRRPRPARPSARVPGNASASLPPLICPACR